MVATKVGNYFVDSYTKPHTWAWGQPNPVTGHPGHARLNVPVDHSNVWEFGEALRKHPRVVSISKGLDKVGPVKKGKKTKRPVVSF